MWRWQLLPTQSHTISPQMADSSIQLTGTATRRITIRYTVPGLIQESTIHFSRLLPSPPSAQGEPGDFFVSSDCVFYLKVTRKWVVAHFNQRVAHPLINGLWLSYTQEGPCWADATHGGGGFGPGWTQARIAAHFHEAIDYHLAHIGPGSDPNDPIDVDSD